MTQVASLVDAFDAFIVGCIDDGTWDSIKASCIMAGWSNLSGALVPLVGTAPTNFNFVAGDYSRKTGLVGDGSTKYLDSNRAANADPQDNVHISVYRTVSGSLTKAMIGAIVSSTDDTAIDYFTGWRSAARSVYNIQSVSIGTLGLLGISRANSSNYTFRLAQSNNAISRASAGNSVSGNYFIFNRSGGNYISNSRLTFYSIGESLDLALLDSRVTQLMTGIASALPLDVDAAAYISAVEAADGQSLEPGVKLAIDRFVVGCKDDGIWSAIKASCILAGARTLAGALVPLVGTAPTNNNFVSGDYSRKTGLVGDGSTKYLDSNRAANADPQDNVHISVYRTVSGSLTRAMIGAISSSADDTAIDYFAGWRSAARSIYDVKSVSIGTLGLLGISRANSSNYTFRLAQSNNAISRASAGNSVSGNYFIFNRSGGNYISDSRLTFYSIGESLDLALLDNRVTVLMSDIQNAIP